MERKLLNNKQSNKSVIKRESGRYIKIDSVGRAASSFIIQLQRAFGFEEHLQEQLQMVPRVHVKRITAVLYMRARKHVAQSITLRRFIIANSPGC